MRRFPLATAQAPWSDSVVRTSGAVSCNAVAAWLAALGVALAACGPIRYVGGVTGGASDAVEAARDARAEELAPYWWTRAVTYLARARHEAADADWQAATRFGRLAQEAARKAVEEAAAAAKDPSKRPLDPKAEPKAAPAKESSLPPPARRTALASAQAGSR
jgi:hypothetical protein